MASVQTTAEVKIDNSSLIKMNTKFDLPMPQREAGTLRYAAPSQTNTSLDANAVPAYKLKHTDDAPQPELPILGKNEAPGNVMYVGEDYVICQIINANKSTVEIRLPKVLFDFDELHSGMPFSLSLNNSNGFRTPEVKPRNVMHKTTDLDAELNRLIDSIA